jgi:DEAD/DEAH box helicase domain-containing protein
MSHDAVIEALRTDSDLVKDFVAWRELPAVPARYGEYPPGADPRLVAALRKRGVEQLYTHQSAAWQHVRQGKNVVVVTPTASGKTLCYNLPVLSSILDNSASRALYLFPTKALSQDQMQSLHGLITDLDVDIKTYTYDGDTPGEARRKIREAGHIVVTNPDMLHTGVLPHHTKWVKLFENLRFVVIDELHQYRGVFGSHVANVIRRIHRICRFYRSNPQFICCSATIANPKELGEQLLGGPCELVDDNGAPCGKRIIGLYNPPVVNKQLGIRRSAVRSAETVATILLRGGVQTIVFAPSRVRVELLLHRLRGALKRRLGEPTEIFGYRGGYLPNERRRVERGLRDGSIRGVVSTNALELGIDIGSLQASVLAGFPGTLASLWQQLGRAGRRGDVSLGVVVVSSSPLNQYVATHPEYLFETPLEAGRIDKENLLVRISHIKCAAFELPFQDGEEFGPDTAELLGMLAQENILVQSGGQYHWMADSFPAEGVSLRSAAIDNFVVIEQGPQTRVIGEVDRPAAPLLIHDEAIYMHGGVQYHVDRLEWKEKKAYVHKVDVDYYTDANLAVDLEVLESFATKTEGAALVQHGEVAIGNVATIFKKIRLTTGENIGWGKIQLPEETRHTTAYWLSFPNEGVESLTNANRLQEALRGVAHLLRHLAPIFLLCDPRDLQHVVQVRSPYTGQPTLFLYENQPGGVGMAARLFEIHASLMSAGLELIRRCSCPDGCPGCVGPATHTAPIGKEAAINLLELLVGAPRSDPPDDTTHRARELA